MKNNIEALRKLKKINKILQGLLAPKPTQDDLSNGRCIDIHTTD